jgi:hypothetical protein
MDVDSTRGWCMYAGGSDLAISHSLSRQNLPRYDTMLVEVEDIINEFAGGSEVVVNHFTSPSKVVSITLL